MPTREAEFGRARRLIARVLVVAASLFLGLALVTGYVRGAAVDSDQFANRATAALQDDSVRSLIAEKLTDEVVLKRQRDLLAARPLIQSAASGIVASRAFASLFRAAVRLQLLENRLADQTFLTLSDIVFCERLDERLLHEQRWLATCDLVGRLFDQPLGHVLEHHRLQREGGSPFASLNE